MHGRHTFVSSFAIPGVGGEKSNLPLPLVYAQPVIDSPGLEKCGEYTYVALIEASPSFAVYTYQMHEMSFPSIPPLPQCPPPNGFPFCSILGQILHFNIGVSINDEQDFFCVK